MKLRSGLILALILGFGTTACASGGGGASAPAPGRTPTAPSGGKILRQGERPRKNSDTKAAQKALNEAEKAGSEAEAKPFYRQALTSAEAAIAADARNPLPYMQAGIAHLGLGEYVEADQAFDKATELRPLYEFEIEGMRERAWISLYQEAAPLVNSGDYEAAAAIYEKANAIYDARPEVMITLGQVYAQLRKHDKALKNLKRAMDIIHSERASEMDSATVASWNEQAKQIPIIEAQVLADAGRFEEAIEAFKGLLVDDPNNLLYLRNLATLLVQSERTDEALAVYDKLMARSDLTSQDYYAIGVGYYQASNFTKAAEAFGGAAGKSPNDRDAIEMWTRSLQIDSVWAKIPPVAERWIALDPNNRNARLIMAQASQKIGNEQTASDMVASIEALDVYVENLQLNRNSSGGADVTGSVTNKKLDAGTPVTITFTFFDEAGNTLGTASQEVKVGETDMAEVFRVTFNSTEKVGGYGYQISK